MKSRRNTDNKRPSPKKPKNLDDVPVTVELFKELQESINSNFMSMNKRFESMDKRFDSIDKRFDSMDKKIDSVRDELKGDIHKLEGQIHEVKILNEEQNSRNKFVIDQYVTVYEEQRDLKVRVDQLEKTAP